MEQQKLPIVIIFIIIICGLLTMVTGQDISIGFPETEIQLDATKQNADNKAPIFLPGRCAQNELLYPGDHKDDWVCDCKPGYLYYPPKNECFKAYRQGPCKKREFLILPHHRFIPECRTNPCHLDGHVNFRKHCYGLDKSGPCALPELSFVVGINVTTLEIDCIQQRITLNDRFGETDDGGGGGGGSGGLTTDSSASNEPDEPEFETEYKCLKGGRRWVNGLCNVSQ